MNRYKYRICFEKDGLMRFIGHLDLLRLFQRTIKRAGLPVAYSAGYNPHQLVSFAMPLPIGHSSAAEYADVGLTQPHNCIAPLLSAQLPDGLQIVSVRQLRESERSAAAQTAAAMYEIEFPEGLNLGKPVSEIMSAKSIIIEKKTKSGAGAADIRPDIINLYARGNILHAMLASGSARNLKPELLVKHIYGDTEYNPFKIKYRRIEIFQCTASGYEPLSKP